MDWRQLLAKPQDWETIKSRADIVRRIRSFFRRRQFLEIQTPLLAPALIPESYLEIFETTVTNESGRQARAYLTPSPELWHKKLLVAGAARIFEITKSFRNTDGGSPRHNFEFTMLEWYRTGVDYCRTMRDCEQLVRALGGKRIDYQGARIRLDQSFERLTVAEAFSRWAKVRPEVLNDRQELVELAKRRGYQAEDADWETVFNLIFVREVEPRLGFGRPTLIYDYPASFAPLARPSARNPLVKERFELYLAGVELADGYSELTDFAVQAAEFEKEQKMRFRQEKISHPADADFLRALEVGLPPCSGVALGLDRLVMVLLDKKSLDEVILFSGREIFPFPE